MEHEFVERVRHVSNRVDVTYRPCQPPEDMTPYLTGVEVLLTYRASFDPGTAPHLKWIQLTGAGIDHLQSEPILKTDVVITNAHLFATPIAEYVFGSILCYSRKFSQTLSEFQTKREWPRDPWKTHVGRELNQCTLGIVGYGDIGRAVARIGQGFGMRVVATRMSLIDPSEQDGVQLLPVRDLDKLLNLSDYVVVCVPFTPQTEGLIGEQELRAMKPESYLVNVSRGKVLDQAALIKALREGGIAGAGLDVFAEEPLPKESELFELPNVILTPHIAGMSSRYSERLADLFCENLRRYLKGERLMNVVDKKRGY
jgi:phosphoglycerate dehydrogenase-like enzyme